ncbi:hypothetical protein FB563_8293 [Streptomyces puniciscabiei]|uniref:Uncharacterized protein n=1 Tax=Streptomyces puniciscabiei TaxID=164348 RepID=A0A542SXL6_9ACTN|nr:hypothetical protein FB563_8293 [Streptomyces puniciscabiei]
MNERRAVISGIGAVALGDSRAAPGHAETYAEGRC